MERFDRQRRIPSWNQERLARARVLVCGRGWLGCFGVWGLASLGIGEILWLGEPLRDTERMAQWLLADPGPLAGTTIIDYPFDLEFGGEVEWVAAGERIDVVLDASGERDVDGSLEARADPARVVRGSAIAGGWIGEGNLPEAHAAPDRSSENPVTAMVVAGLLVDAARESLVPLDGGQLVRGPVGMNPPLGSRGDRLFLVGVGGIGVYAAALAALLGVPIHLKDDDRVEASNLNRQGLFTTADVGQRAFKSLAARDRLRRLFPRATVTADTSRAGPAIAGEVRDGHASLLLSAVDNAETRLVLQAAARELSMPIVQAGLAVFAADVFVQEHEGPLLDEQMHGVMRRAVDQERSRRRSGGCANDPSYVVPGMIAGGLMMHRALQIAGPCRVPGPIRWRAGRLPAAEEVRHEFTFDIAE